MSNQLKAKPQPAVIAPSLSGLTRRSLKSLELEGIILSDAAMADVRLLDKGEITREEYTARAISRAKAK